jgi:hypothetical protein
MGSNLILTIYFTQKGDPQRAGVHHEPDQFEKIQKWYESVVRLGMHAVIFHDGLSNEFTERYANENVQFMPYSLQSGRSLNDERFYCYLDFLKTHPEVEHVFMTDLFDVDFLRNPFDLVDEGKYDFYAQEGMGGLPNGKKKYAADQMKQVYGKILYPDRVSLNAGIIGGHRSKVLAQLELMTKDLSGDQKGYNTHTGVFNRRIHDVCSDPERIFYGFPLHSEFKKYEEDRGFYIRHK